MKVWLSALQLGTKVIQNQSRLLEGDTERHTRNAEREI